MVVLERNSQLRGEVRGGASRLTSPLLSSPLLSTSHLFRPSAFPHFSLLSPTRYHDYLQTQIGNPEGADKPNKKYSILNSSPPCLNSSSRVLFSCPSPPLTYIHGRYYDPRMAVRAAEDSTVNRLKQCFEDLNCVGRLGLGEAPEPSNVLGPRRGALPV